MADYRKMWEELGPALRSTAAGIRGCIFITGKPSGFYGLL